MSRESNSPFVKTVLTMNQAVANMQYSHRAAREISFDTPSYSQRINEEQVIKDLGRSHGLHDRNRSHILGKKKRKEDVRTVFNKEPSQELWLLYSETYDTYRYNLKRSETNASRS
jgi:hypothetical protein